MTTIDQLVSVTARHNEIVKRLGNGSLDPDAVLDAYQRIIEGRFDEPSLIHGMFVSPEAQIANMRGWNLEHGLGYIDAYFVEAEEAARQLTWPEDRLVVHVLVPYAETVDATLETLWTIASGLQPNNWRWDGMKSGPENLRLLDGIEHKPGLRWEAIDLGANWDPKDGIRPMDVRGPNSAHAGILAAAAHFPKWVQAMDGEKVPYVWLPGYQVNVAGEAPWRRVPYLGWDSVLRKVNLHALWKDHRFYKWACPVVRE